MKQLYVLRHSIPDYSTDTLTEEGIQYCAQMKEKLPKMNVVVSSPFGRTQKTARDLTSIDPNLDERASLPILSAEQHQKAVEAGKTHKYSFVGALFDIKDVRPIVKAKGEELVALIKDTLLKLPEGGNALIISHSWTMAPAKKILLNESFDSPPEDFKFIEGFIVDSDYRITNF